MEFNFKINELFKEPIVKITNTLLPPGFTGDRRAVRECQTKVAEVINAMGLASAAAQGLTKPITTADKLRNSDYTVYLLIDLQGGSKGNGCVTGLLKVGRKGLYIFDPAGCHHQLKPLCVLDFYIHESRQRTGLGRRLFEHMLKEEDVEAVRLAIDRPSKKFLGFLSKHYNLNRVVPQMNNFVVFEGFFVPVEGAENGQNNNRNKLLDNYTSESSSSFPEPKNIVAPGLGRYGAHHASSNMMEQVNPVIGDYSTESSSSYHEPTSRVAPGLGRHGAHHPSDRMMEQVNPVIGDYSTESSRSFHEPTNTVAAGVGRHGAPHPSNNWAQENPAVDNYSTESSRSFHEPTDTVAPGLGRHGAPHPSDNWAQDNYSTESSRSFHEPLNTVAPGLGRHGAHHASDHMMEQENPVIADYSTESSRSFHDPQNIVAPGAGRYGAPHSSDTMKQEDPIVGNYSTESSRSFQEPTKTVAPVTVTDYSTESSRSFNEPTSTVAPGEGRYGAPRSSNNIGEILHNQSQEWTPHESTGINLVANHKSEHGTKAHNGLHATTNITAPTLGRYGAPRPPCSMGQIIHNQSPQLGPNDSSGSETETSINEEINSSKLERPRSLSINTSIADDQPDEPAPQPPPPAVDEPENNISTKSENAPSSIETQLSNKSEVVKEVEEKIAEMKIVGKAQSEPTNSKPVTPKKPNDHRLTEQGHLDLKFYHSKLW